MHINITSSSEKLSSVCSMHHLELLLPMQCSVVAGCAGGEATCTSVVCAPGSGFECQQASSPDHSCPYLQHCKPLNRACHCRLARSIVPAPVDVSTASYKAEGVWLGLADSYELVVVPGHSFSLLCLPAGDSARMKRKKRKPASVRVLVAGYHPQDVCMTV